MDATSPLDRRLLRRLRAGPSHAYALAAEAAQEEGGPDRATVYRRLQALERRGLVVARVAAGRGPERRVLRLTPSGEEALREELREALGLLMEAFDARRSGGGGGGAVRPPVVFVSGSRLSAIEGRILRSLGASFPRKVHLVLAPGADGGFRAPPGVAASEGGWASLPLRDGLARTLFVNELPPKGLPSAAREWARVLAPGGVAHVVAPAPLPRGVDPFLDFFADLHAELFPDVAAAPEPARVEAALRGAFGAVSTHREGGQVVWTARRPLHSATSA